MDDSQKVEAAIDSGDIVNMKSLLAFDEELVCKQCNAMFTMGEGNWEGTHPKYKGVLAFGIKCPNCERANVSYWKTKKLIELEKRLDKIINIKKLDKRRKQYQREFMRVQKKFGRYVGVVNETV